MVDEVYVMLMMMRADDSYTPATAGCSAEELLACITADDYDACIAACSDEEGEEENLPGYAKVSGKAAAEQTVAVNAVNKKVGTITLKAGENDTTVSSIVVAHSGLGDASTVSAQLFLNGVAATSQKEMSKSSKSVTLKLSPAIVMKANSSITLDVVASLGGTKEENANETHNFSVTAVNVANGTADGTPVALGTLKTTSYEVGNIGVTLTAGDAVSAGANDKVIATVKLTPTSNATINGFTITKDSGNEDLDELVNNVKAYYNDEVIGDVEVTADKIVVSNLKLDRNNGQSATIEVRGDVIYAGTNVNSTFTIEKNEVLAVETSTNENMGNAKVGPTANFTVNGADLTLKNMVTKTQTVVPGTSEVELLNVQVSAKSELEINGYTLSFTSTDKFDKGVCSDGVSLNQAACETATPAACKKATSITAAAGDDTADCLSTSVLKAVGDATTANEIYIATAAHPAAVWTPNFVDNLVTVYVDGEDYEMKASPAAFTNKESFVVDEKNPVTIRVVANLNEDAVAATYQMRLALNTAKTTNGNGTVNLTSANRDGHQTKVAGATATYKTATKAAPVTSSLFANKDQEIARFAIKADGDKATIKTLQLTATVDGTTATPEELAELLNGNIRLVDAETDEEISASFDDMVKVDGTHATIAVKSMNYEIAKDTTANIKVMANIASISDTSTNVIGGTLNVNVTAGTFRTPTTASKNLTNGTPVTKPYTFRPTAPSITLARVADTDNMFEVVITNEDENDNGIDIDELVFRVRTTAANADFTANVCIVDDVNTTTCTLGDATLDPTTNAGTPNFGKSITKDWAANQEIAENDSATFYILVDGEFIAPETLQADISSLKYGVNETLATDDTVLAERYNISSN